MDVLFTNKNLVEVQVKDDAVKIPFQMSYFYGPSHREDKKCFWDSIKSLGNDVIQPWCCIRDFNELIWPNKKQGETMWCPSRIRYLQDFKEVNGLFDLDFSCPEFTWVKKLDGLLAIKKWLDWGLVNASWLDL